MSRTRPLAMMAAAAALTLAAPTQAATAAAPAVRTIVQPAPATAGARPEAATTPRTTRIMPMGDSITDQGTQLGYRGYLLRSLLAARKRVDYVGSMRTAGYPLADADHEGHPGWRTDEIARVAGGAVAYRKPDIVLLMSGSNDLEQGASAATAAARMTRLLNTIHAARPSAQIIVLTVIPDGSAPASTVAAYNRALRPVVISQHRQGRRVNLFDVSTATRLGVDYWADNTHPNDQGQRRLAAAVYRSLVYYLPR